MLDSHMFDVQSCRLKQVRFKGTQQQMTYDLIKLHKELEVVLFKYAGAEKHASSVGTLRHNHCD